VDDVNKYFTSFVCDKTYSRAAVLSELHSQINADDAHPAVKASYSDFDIIVILSIELLKQLRVVIVFLSPY